VRRVARDGTKSAPVTIAGIGGTRTSGLPRMVVHGNTLYLAWIDGDSVRTARARLR
jgi:hypothetical protein